MAGRTINFRLLRFICLLIEPLITYAHIISASEVAGLVGNICLCYADADNDGYGDANGVGQEQISQGVCPEGMVKNKLDCNDANDAINPDASEICDGVDNNCDGNIDIGDDIDGDGYTTAQGDCNDCDDSINPGEAERCGNDIDDNCNGEIDEAAIADVLDCSILYGFSPFKFYIFD